MKNLYQHVISLLVGLLILTLSACAPSNGDIPGAGDGQESESGTSLASTRWMLVTYGRSGNESPVIQGAEITLEIEEDGQVGGSGGCNTFGAQHEVSDGEITFTQIISMQIACTTVRIMDQEEMYFQALQSSVPMAAILLPLTFFLSVLSPEAQEPNALIHLAYLGAAPLAVGVFTLGVGLVRSGRDNR